MLHALVTAANVQDRDGGVLLLSTLFGQFPFLRKLFADSAYAGPIFHDGAAKAMHNLEVEIVKRADHAKGFIVEPKRWIVERSIAWLNRCRRLAKDWKTATTMRLPSSTSLQSVSCSEGYVIPHEVSGRTLRDLGRTDWFSHMPLTQTLRRHRAMPFNKETFCMNSFDFLAIA